MIRIRYMIVDHPSTSDGMLHCIGKVMQHVPPIHPYVPVYHWVRMDDSTIFVKSTYHDQHHATLIAMPTVTLLPSTFSRQLVADAITQQGTSHHHYTLLGHSVPYDRSTITSDLVDWFAANENGIFDHEV